MCVFSANQKSKRPTLQSRNRIVTADIIYSKDCLDSFLILISEQVKLLDIKIESLNNILKTQAVLMMNPSPLPQDQ